ncbi:CENP-B protein [Mycena venus]|uniref:CENP-B protein n=1 Tax=Mycena venus TaxID=2733690 RepID=A0A8H6Z822_9AGAR|nr:CENP-B protein [Mycena venus]
MTELERAYAPPYNIRPENLYNCDEKGFMMGVSAHEHVIVIRRSELDCNWKTIAIDPLFREIIMKGKRPSYSWTKDSKLEKASRIAASPNGWTDNELGVVSSKNLFEPETRAKANGAWRALVFDNHESHVSAQFIEDFSRLFPRAREDAFTRTNIVRDFEMTGIYLFNKKIFPFMQDYYANLTRDSKTGATGSSQELPASIAPPPTPIPPPGVAFASK